MKIKVTDVLAIICFSWALYYINFGKEAVKAFITGGVIVWWVMKRVMERIVTQLLIYDLYNERRK